MDRSEGKYGYHQYMRKCENGAYDSYGLKENLLKGEWVANKKWNMIQKRIFVLIEHNGYMQSI